ncbi:MAG: hypothetical protein ACTSXP_15600 [Promethearchaeota archaeon]
MFSENDLKEIVEAKIRVDEVLGEQVGGSGHSGYISFNIEKINEPKQVKGGDRADWEITYQYRIIIETEFTYYPDNPPYEYLYEKSIIVNDDGKVIEESKKKLVQGPPGFFDL